MSEYKRSNAGTLVTLPVGQSEAIDSVGVRIAFLIGWRFALSVTCALNRTVLIDSLLLKGHVTERSTIEFVKGL